MTLEIIAALFVVLAAVVGLVFAMYKFYWVKKMPEGATTQTHRQK